MSAMALPGERPDLSSTPKTWRDWAIGLAIVGAVGGLLFAAYQPRVERGESECRSKCASAGETYRYIAPTRSRPDSCTCLKTQ
jgi:hypothetical protein